MKKVFVSILLTGFIFNFVNAEGIKETKELKQVKETKEIKQKELDKLNEEIIAILKNN